jgi:hypothetical protein
MFKSDATSPKDAQQSESPLTSKTGDSEDRVKELVLQHKKSLFKK